MLRHERELVIESALEPGLIRYRPPDNVRDGRGQRADSQSANNNGARSNLLAGKRYLSYAAHGSAASLIVGIRPERLATVAELFDRLERRNDLIRVVKLSGQAASSEGALRVWLAAWTALEIFIGKRFGFYERVFMERVLAGRSDPATLGHFRRIHEVMTRNYRLTDHFRIITACLFPDSADVDIKAFKALKKQRDAVAHGADVPESELRADQIRAFLLRYLHADLIFRE